jgi:O-methyltransferase
MSFHRRVADGSLVARNTVRRALHYPDWRLWRKYGDDTMLDEDQFIDNMTLVRTVTVPGDLVEAGVWRGGMSAAMAEALPGRTSVLFDSFEGLPELGVEDAGTPEQVPQGMKIDEAITRATVARSGQSFEIRQGWFADTVPKYAAEGPAVAVLRLDGDLYESTMVCLEHLYPLVASGGLVIIDDYGGVFTGCTRAVHDYLSETRSAVPIKSTRCNVFHLRP